MAKLTLSLEISPSDLLTLFALLRQRDESGGRPASPFSGGFRMRGPFNLEDLFETLARETDDKGEEPEEPFEGFNRVAESIQELRRRARPTRPTGATGAGDDTPPDPKGSEPQGFDPGDDPFFEGN
jgi:hypothetical protein